MSEKRAIPHLLDEPPISVYPSLAVALGNVNKAIILQQLHYLLQSAKLSKNTYVLVDDKWWVYNSYKEWQKYFPWLAEVTIKGLFGMLEHDGLIVSQQGVKDKLDRRKWYTIDYDAYLSYISSIGQKVSDEHEIENIPSDGQKVSDVIKESENSNSEIKKKEPRKRVSVEKPFTYPEFVKDWRKPHMERFISEHGTELHVMMECDGFTVPIFKTLQPPEQKRIISVVRDLKTAGVDWLEYQDLLAFCRRQWKDAPITVMAQHVTKWRDAKNKPPSTDLITETGINLSKYGIERIIR